MAEAFDPAPVLAGLKDFQRQTSDHVFRCLYGDTSTSHRFLVADEVGLGKTLVARGVIARTIQHLKRQGTERIDILYVCSNAEIARQNVRRLNVTGKDDFVLAERITMLPARVRDLAQHDVNFVSFTPGTSFDLKGGQGNRQERAMLRLMLEAAWGRDVVHGSGSERLFQGGVRSWDRWRQQLRETRRAHGRHLDADLVAGFARVLSAEDDRRSAAGERTLRSEFDELCQLFRNPSASRPPSADRLRRRFVGALRDLLARACITALEPDLIILDEFQRFRHLLDEKTPAGQLAHDLFSFQDDGTGANARILLLSATPYKMYTLSGDETGDDHYRDFTNTVRFLLNDDEATEQFASELRDFRQGLYQLHLDGGLAARDARSRVEKTLRRIICRTERLAVTEDRSGMLRTRPTPPLSLAPSDLAGYLAVDRVARRLGAPDSLEYWKSSPYLLNFMDDYKLKVSFAEGVEDPTTAADLAGLLRDERCLLPWSDVRGYRQIDPGNARLRQLCDEVIGAGAWRLLWLPPSLPYHQPAGPYAEGAVSGMTKRLVFSSWAIVPKVIATMTSYAAERMIMTNRRGRPAWRNTADARKGQTGRLNFAMTSGRLTGMPYLALIYPSVTLADLGDPLTVAHELLQPLPALTQVVERIRQRLRPVVDNVTETYADPAAGREDERWYWAAPFLLDETTGQAAAFLDQPNVTAAWEGTDPPREADRLRDHVGHLRQFLDGSGQLGRPPADLVDVLAWMALAGPGVVGLRSLSRATGSPRAALGTRNAAARVAWALRSLFNGPEVTELVREGDDQPYWRQLLTYAAGGNLQAVLDEYAHVLIEARGFVEKSADDVVPDLAAAMHDTISLRTVNYAVHEIEVGDDRVELEPRRLRSHFALRLAEERGDDGSRTRSSEVRDAFNSPFWPFVLATTSVGQEGLDFHLYCHAVVHWNLPSNPVDMEQREGRVHRYKGHAVRKNLAERFGEEVLGDGAHDPWETLFETGRRSRAPTENDLVPYWVFTTPNGAVIERHVPTLPLSREVGQAHALQRTLAAYRLAFGQPRQEDLIAYLQSVVDAEELETLASQLRIDLSPA